MPVLLKGSRYADRVPIGKTDVLQNFKHDRLKKFYTDWYRPDLMAVVAVGDFDQAQVEALIKTRFAGLTNPAGAPRRQVYDVPDHPGTTYSVLTDKELTTTSVEIDHLLPTRPYGTVGVYRQRLVDGLFSSMLSARLAELTQKPDAPFSRRSPAAGASSGRPRTTRRSAPW